MSGVLSSTKYESILVLFGICTMQARVHQTADVFNRLRNLDPELYVARISSGRDGSQVVPLFPKKSSLFLIPFINDEESLNHVTYNFLS